MDGCHQAVFNAEFIVQNFGNRCQAVCGAGCVRNKLCTFNIRIGVDAANEHRCIVFGRRGHDDVFCAGIDVTLRFFFSQEQTGRFDDIVSLNFVPLQISRIFLSRDADGFAVDHQFAVFDFNRAVEAAMHGVIFEHISHIIDINQIINADDFNIVSGLGGTENQTSDTAKTVNTYANYHISFLIKKVAPLPVFIKDNVSAKGVRTAPHGRG